MFTLPLTLLSRDSKQSQTLLSVSVTSVCNAHPARVRDSTNWRAGVHPRRLKAQSEMSCQVLDVCEIFSRAGKLRSGIVQAAEGEHSKLELEPLRHR